MKYLTYILRNARRNPVRSLLTIASSFATGEVKVADVISCQDIEGELCVGEGH